MWFQHQKYEKYFNWKNDIQNPLGLFLKGLGGI